LLPITATALKSGAALPTSTDMILSCGLITLKDRI
jgi:hypothetical protein